MVLVVDTSVAQASSEKEDCSRSCLRLLVMIDDHNHKVAFCSQLLEEWQHAGSYATGWLVKMRNTRRVLVFNISKKDRRDLKNLVERAGEPQQRGTEDVHLLLLALRASKIVFSRDDNARKLFRQCSEVSQIHWANPCTDAHIPEWFAKGLAKRDDLKLKSA